VVACPALVYGQAKPAPNFFVVCGSQPNEPTVYLSGVLEGPAAAFANFRTGFSEYLAQRYAYKGAVVCGPTNTAVNAQKFIETRSAALRNAKKNVVDTGWSQSGGALASVVPAVNGVQSAKPQVRAAANAAPAVAPAAAPSNGNAAGSSQLAGVLSTLFGSSGGGSNDAGGASTAKAGQAKSTAGAGATTGSGVSGDGSSGGQNPMQQVSAALTSAFAANAASGSASADSSPKTQPTVPESGLGSAQAQNTKLVVYGCGRQDTQIACVTDLANQNQKETLVKAGEVWKDAFIVDDRGDRHPRTSGFFLNVDGDQRPQLDISYGKSARFILMFDGVQTKVQKVALRSSIGGLDVEEINLIGAGGKQ
jgi:hypothetical protein